MATKFFIVILREYCFVLTMLVAVIPTALEASPAPAQYSSVTADYSQPGATATETTDIDGTFWLTTELVAVEWRKGCLTTGGCAEPRFKLTQTNIVNNEQVSISWSLLNDFDEDHSRIFVSHWKLGTPNDITMICEVVGIDPTYGFPRICDATANAQIFQTEVLNEVVNRIRRSDAVNLNEGDKIVVGLKGKCFNASLRVQRHEQRCPWCEDKQEQLAFVAQPEMEPTNSSGLMYYFGGGEQLLCVAVTVLAGIAIISTSAFACLLIAFIKHKRTPPAKCRVASFPTTGIRIDPMQLADDCRYEMPWDQKYRPLPHWINNHDELIMSSSPKDSGSPTSPQLYYQSSRTAIGGLTHYESPTTSINGRHDDSGLESV